MKHTTTHCTNCPFGLPQRGGDMEWIWCGLQRQPSIIVHTDVEELEDEPIPAECPLLKESITVTLTHTTNE